ncbi:hypothetical protein PUNSTDRAFT_129717 [Punctularia strigosozonata HHB-11173 SS5]|uniref:uncharacterized protein n=1 Tax=Punctularia strigosozonata (strain HHB-11173) TaxID=741275 RepID=UPI00044167D1|nr:uncharacterized protein PUNSTDRAFT_129717 [Punctularia strigosozonata HHB-11173 SS5]EIN14074.1 hypothetical protein PUNSTDRAFT_129717 [Punctularia strigosozonata HHB-11173 SS5]
MAPPAPPVPLASSAAGRVSGKPWKSHKSPAVRTHLPDGVKTSFEHRMEKTKREKAIKQLQAELTEEKEAERLRRRQVTMDRRKAAEERRRADELKAQMGARKAARLRKKAGRTKKINH